MNNSETSTKITDEAASTEADKPTKENKTLHTFMIVAAVSAVIGVTLPAIANLKLQGGKAEQPVAPGEGAND